ncbi:MAG: hypothetical protein VX252_03835 [Myxococcota bacterium]|nr:hypothetical protein [Myxococcota bacterium]
MTRFEFVLVLVSIVVGLGITDILTNVAREIRLRRKVVHSFCHSALTAALFVALLQFWWESWKLSQFEGWNFALVLVALGSPTLLFIVAHLLYPTELAGKDLGRYYDENARLIWLLLVLATVLSVIMKPIILDVPLWVVGNASSGLVVGLGLILAFVPGRRLHGLLISVVILVMLADIFGFSFYL